MKFPQIYIFCHGGCIQGVAVRDIPEYAEVTIVDRDDVGHARYREELDDIMEHAVSIY